MTRLLVLASLFLFNSLLFAVDKNQPTNLVPLNGGVNLKDHPTQIKDSESPNMSNWVSDENSTRVRNGTRKFNQIAITSNPINSMHRSYGSNGSKYFIVTAGTGVFISTFDHIPKQYDIYLPTGVGNFTLFHTTYGSLPANLIYSFADFADHTIFVNRSTSPLQFLANSTISAIVRPLPGTPPKAQHIASVRNYLLLANTTDAPNRVFYSDIGNPYSFPLNNSFDLDTVSGEQIRAISSHKDGVNFYMDSSVWQMRFTKLASNPDEGDQFVERIFNGFGCIADYSFINFGDGDFFLSRDGFRVVAGASSLIVSREVEPIVNRMIKSGLYTTTRSFYDAKNKWIWVAYQDDLAFPPGKNNRVLIYDLRLNQWYPIDGIHASSFAAWDGPGDKLQLFYGDSKEGYVVGMDMEEQLVDAPKEITLMSGDNPSNCGGEPSQVRIQGTLSLSQSAVGGFLSCTDVPTSISLFPDGTPVKMTDYLQYYQYVETTDDNSTANGAVNLEFSNPGGNKYLEFTPSTWTVSNQWVLQRVRLQDMTCTGGACDKEKRIRGQLLSVGASFTFEDITGNVNLLWDDIRIVQSSENAIMASRESKPISLGVEKEKTWDEVDLDMERNTDSRLRAEFSSDFGESVVQRATQKDYDKVVYVASTNVIVALNKNDYSILWSSSTVGNNINYLYRTDDELYGLNTTVGTLFKLDPSSAGLLAKTSTFANGDTFNTPRSLTAKKGIVDVLDSRNQRVVRFKDSDNKFVFISSFGGLGLSTPSCIERDNNNYWIFNDGKHNILRFSSDFSKKLAETFVDSLNHGYIRVVDDKLYAAYQHYSDLNDVNGADGNVLQVRDKYTLQLLKQVKQKDTNVDTQVTGLAVDGNFIYLASTNTYTPTGDTFLFQEYARDDLSLLRQFRLGQIRSLATNRYYTTTQRETLPIGLAGKYLTIRYFVDEPRDRFRIFNQVIRYAIKDR